MMLKTLVRIIALTSAFVFLAPQPRAFCEDSQDVDDEREYNYFQGTVSSDGGYWIIVNENRKVYLRQDTRYYDQSGNLTAAFKPVERQWLYVEAALNSDGSMDAVKVYSLPRYIKRSEMSKYPFIQAPWP